MCVHVCAHAFVKVDVFVTETRHNKKLLSYNGHIEAWVRYKVPNWQFTEATAGHSVSQASV